MPRSRRSDGDDDEREGGAGEQGEAKASCGDRAIPPDPSKPGVWASAKSVKNAGGPAVQSRQSFAVTASSIDAKRSRASARRVGTCSVGTSPAGGV
jgi:hypothetical protein